MWDDSTIAGVLGDSIRLDSLDWGYLSLCVIYQGISHAHEGLCNLSLTPKAPKATTRGSDNDCLARR